MVVLSPSIYIFHFEFKVNSALRMKAEKHVKVFNELPIIIAFEP